MAVNIEEARRRVKNRRRREEAVFEANLERMYELDELVAQYLAENSDYIDRYILQAVEEAYGAYELPLRVGFDYRKSWLGPIPDEFGMDEDGIRYLWAETENRDPSNFEPVFACIFDSRNALGTDEYDLKYIAFTFCEVLADIYAEAGWTVSDIDTKHEFWELYAVDEGVFDAAVARMKKLSPSQVKISEWVEGRHRKIKEIRYAYSFELKY